MKVFKFLWCSFSGIVFLFLFTGMLLTAPDGLGLMETLVLTILLVVGVYLIAESLHTNRL